MGEHKEELGCIISMFKGAITTEQRVCTPSGAATRPDCGGTPGFTPSEGKGLRDPFKADNNEFICGFVLMPRACSSSCFSSWNH